MFTHPQHMHACFTSGLLLSVCVIGKEQFNIFITQWQQKVVCENFTEVQN